MLSIVTAVPIQTLDTYCTMSLQNILGDMVTEVEVEVEKLASCFEELVMTSPPFLHPKSSKTLKLTAFPLWDGDTFYRDPLRRNKKHQYRQLAKWVFVLKQPREKEQ